MSGTVSGSERSVVPFPCVWAHVGGATFSRAVPCVLAHAGGAHSVAPFRKFWHTPAGGPSPTNPHPEPNQDDRTNPQTHTHTRARLHREPPLTLLGGVLHSIRFDSIPFHSITVRYTTRLHREPQLALLGGVLHSIPFHSIPFHSIPFHYCTLHDAPAPRASACASRRRARSTSRAPVSSRRPTTPTRDALISVFCFGPSVSYVARRVLRTHENQTERSRSAAATFFRGRLERSIARHARRVSRLALLLRGELYRITVHYITVQYIA